MTEEVWYREITPYQWRVLVCAWLGWCLDIMDGLLYAIILFPATSQLLGTTESGVIGWYGGIILSIFMIGWALGGLLFGMIADRYGRAKTMALTILVYGIFTGLSGLSQSWTQLALFRFLTGLGTGGEWAAGAALIAESWPERSRAKAAGVMQSAGGVGFFLASLLYLWIGPLGWRWVFAAGILPAFLAFYIRRSLHEPGRWEKVRKSPTPLSKLFTASVKRDLFVGAALAVVATFGFQGAIQWVPTWITAMLRSQGITEVSTQVSLVSMVLTTGSIVGSLSYPPLADRWGRKTALSIYFSGCFLSVPSTFFLAQEFTTALLASPIMGFFVGGIFAGFAVYFPELFPTAIRATAQGFCYNFGRLFSAMAPLATGLLISAHGSFAPAITAVGLVYLLGVLILLFFARETRGQLLPD
ncbi:MAG: MFS transporter [Candidatus Binatia bacterium]